MDDTAERNAAEREAREQRGEEARDAVPPGFWENEHPCYRGPLDDSDESASEPEPAAATRKVLFLDGTDISVTMRDEQTPTFGTLNAALIVTEEAEPCDLSGGLLAALQTKRVRFFIAGQAEARPKDEPLPDCDVPVFALIEGGSDEPAWTLAMMAEAVGRREQYALAPEHRYSESSSEPESTRESSSSDEGYVRPALHTAEPEFQTPEPEFHRRFCALPSPAPRSRVGVMLDNGLISYNDGPADKPEVILNERRGSGWNFCD